MELTGQSETGDEFGWKFSDNYFDLLPFETKHIRIGGKFRKGVITAKSFYGEKAAMISLPGRKTEGRNERYRCDRMTE